MAEDAEGRKLATQMKVIEASMGNAKLKGDEKRMGELQAKWNEVKAQYNALAPKGEQAEKVAREAVKPSFAPVAKADHLKRLNCFPVRRRPASRLSHPAAADHLGKSGCDGRRGGDDCGEDGGRQGGEGAYANGTSALVTLRSRLQR